MKHILRSILACGPQEMDVDAPEATALHRRLIETKPVLRRFYDDVYAFFADQARRAPHGSQLELGSGAGHLQQVLPDVITSDVRRLPNVDRVVSALDLPFDDASLSAIYLLDVFHHLQDVGRFLEEASRCLVPGGRIVMMEPANTLWGRFIYRRFHHEPFEPGAEAWTLPEGGPMSMANGALPWIVFVRDRERFLNRFPEFQIERARCCQPFTYLVSGGLSMRQLVPSPVYPAIQCIEWLTTPAHPLLGMFMQIVLVKAGGQKA